MKPVASLSLDLDNQWSYMKTHGDPGWEQYPSYLEVVVPRVLDLLSTLDLRITFFLVGRDAAVEDHRPLLRSLVAAGHEIGNHSYRHEPWLHRYAEAELDDELARAEEAIADATGVVPRGFRGPGYSLSEPTLRILVRRGYRFDASTLPTYLGPLARAFYFRTARLGAEERRERSLLFGSFADGRRPAGPYRWEVDGRTIVELPVTTIPGCKLPFHVSYLLYLARFTPALAAIYLRSALAACRTAGIGPSMLLHPLDLLDADDVPELAFFPAMAMPHDEKAALVRRFLSVFASSFDVRTVGAHVDALEAGASLRRRAPDFAPPAALVRP